MLAVLAGHDPYGRGGPNGPDALWLEAKIRRAWREVSTILLRPRSQLLSDGRIGNDSVGIVDMNARKVLYRVKGSESRGGFVAFIPQRARLRRQSRRRIGPICSKVQTQAGRRHRVGDDADNS